MKRKNLSLITWGTVAIALFAWILVVMFARTILTEEGQRNWREGDAQEANARETVSLRLHVLARDTKSAREQLDLLTKTEVLEIANMIESVGKSTGVKIKINDAEPASYQQATNAKPQTLNAIDFLVETEGSFRALAHTSILFENLPMLSSVQSLEFERIRDSEGSAKNKTPLWRLRARIKVMTTAHL